MSIYTPFVDKDEIRLLRLHPALYATSPIICTLVHARLSETPKYEALSYVWGTEQNTHSVILNGESHCVGKNLFEALDALHDGKKQFLWVDALCINQSDPRERGHQVAQMGGIYSHASMVHVWLGPSVPQTASAFEWLNNLSFDQFNRSISPQEFSRLCTTEYWERLWIIQEIALATKIQVNCGRYSASWESFASMVLENPWALDSIRDSPVTKLCRLRRAINVTRGTPAMKMSIFMLAETHAHAKCADSRDKIYGLQGFAPSCCRSAISIDYICSAYELCQRILWHEITAHRMSDRITNHAVARAGLWGLGHSIRLHKMLVGGALKQTTVTTTPFEAGYMSASMVPYSDLWKASSQVQAIERGTIRWVSTPLSRIAALQYGEFRVPVIVAMDYALDVKLKYSDLEIIKRKVDCVEQTTITAPFSKPSPTSDMFEMICINRDDLSSAWGNPERLYQLLHSISRRLDQSQPLQKDCVLFWAWNEYDNNRNMIGIAPINTEVGDAIYGFPGTDVIATAHTCSHGDLTVRGRAVKITDTEVIDVAEQKFRYPSLSVPAMQILSKVYL